MIASALRSAASILVLLGLWEAAGRAGIAIALPPFSEVARAAIALTADGALPRALAVTLLPVALGAGLSVILGGLLGLAMGLSRRAEWLSVSLLVCLDTAPMIALVPLLTYLYGIGLAAKLASALLLAVPVMALNCYRGVRAVDPVLLDMHRAFLGGPLRAVLGVVLPAASGVLFAGIRLATAAAFTGVILSELLIRPSGIGDLITHHRSVADFPEMFAAILAIVAVAALTLGLLSRLEVVLLRPDRRPVVP